jgi:integrase
MATCRARGNGTFEFIIKNKELLGKPWSRTFRDKGEGARFCAKMEEQLARGVIPPELLEKKPSNGAGGTSLMKYPTLAHLFRDYLENCASLGADDTSRINTAIEEIGSVHTHSATRQWGESWIKSLKITKRLKPSTIKQKVGAVRRCFDWARRHDQFTTNPFSDLPRGFANYSEGEARKLRDAGVTEVPANVERDRRLEEGEEEKIREVLRDHDEADAMTLAWTLALETAMRMSEIYTLTLDQVDFKKRTIFLDKTKNGDSRQVPMTTVAEKALREYISKHKHEFRDGPTKFDRKLIFPWWEPKRTPSGKATSASIKVTTVNLSRKFGRVFEQAGCADLRFHDHRHEATCRLYERTKLSDVQISRITGHRTMVMLRRYASLRGSDLAAQLW